MGSPWAAAQKIQGKSTCSITCFFIGCSLDTFTTGVMHGLQWNKLHGCRGIFAPVPGACPSSPFSLTLMFFIVISLIVLCLTAAARCFLSFLKHVVTEEPRLCPAVDLFWSCLSGTWGSLSCLLTTSPSVALPCYENLTTKILPHKPDMTIFGFHTNFKII